MSDLGHNTVIVLIAAMITALGLTYFVVIRQDSSVLLSLSSILGGFVGYIIGKRTK